MPILAWLSLAATLEIEKDIVCCLDIALLQDDLIQGGWAMEWNMRGGRATLYSIVQLLKNVLSLIKKKQALPDGNC